MHNVVKCERCTRIMIAELFENHTCSPSYRGSQEIEYDFVGEFIDEQGRKVTQVFGMDGITYRFFKSGKEKTPSPVTLASAAHLQGDESDDSLTAP